MCMPFLHELPTDHPDRNRPLLGFRYTMPGIMAKTTEVTASFGIAKKTYNDLGPVWTEKHQWSAPDARPE